MKRVLLAVMLLGALAAAASAAAPFTIQGDRKVGGFAIGSGTRAQAIARFGSPSSQTAAGDTCDLKWKRLGLRISFLDFAGDPCTAGGAVLVTLTDRQHWRTAVGLRVGDTAARVKTLYPKAKLHAPDGYWLVVRNSCKETGGQPFPGLLARIGAGKVSALVVTAGVCE